MRTSKIDRKTKETDISFELCLDGGEVSIDTGIGFFDHMLNSMFTHGAMGAKLVCKGDLHVDCHHTIEDCGIVIGMAIKEALGDKGGICRFGSFFVPMDEALSFCSIDISGRPFLVFDASFNDERIGEYDTCMTEEFFRAVAFNAGITLHLKNEYGKNSHHVVESLFKSFAHAFKSACKKNETGEVLSTKGVL